MPIIGILASGVVPFNNPSFLVFGNRSANAWSSTDGITWDFRQAQRSLDGTSEVQWSGIVDNKLYTNSSNDFIYTSTDGLAWNVERWPITWAGGGPFQFSYTEGKWIITDSNIIYNSTDTITWSANSGNIPASGSLNTQVISNGSGTYLVGASAGGAAYSSTNLTTWTTRTIAGEVVQSFAYGAGVWIARVTDSTVGWDRIYSSTNLTTWTSRLSLTAGQLSGQPNGLLFANNLFLAGTDGITDRVYTSTDGITWTSRVAQVGVYGTLAVGYANSYYFAFNVTANKIAYSTDGTTWTSRTVSAADATTEFNSVQYFNNNYYLFGAWDATDGTPVYSSTDLVTWSAVNDSNSILGKYEDYDIYGAVKVNNKYHFAGAGGYIVESNNDFTSWTVRTGAYSTNVINGITYGNSTFVAVGPSGQLQTSTDGITWTSRTSTFGTSGIFKVEFGNSTFVAVGAAGQLRTSTDGITWTTRTSGFGTSAIYNVRYVNNQFITLGAGGVLGNSTNGTTWTTRVPASNTTIAFDISYGAGVYVLAKENNAIFTSTDLTTWTTRTSTLQSGRELTTCLFANNIFVMLADYSASTFAKFTTYQTSTDGITWTSRQLGYAGTDNSSYYFGSIARGGQGIAL